MGGKGFLNEPVEGTDFMSLGTLRFYPEATNPKVRLDKVLIDAGLLGTETDRREATAKDQTTTDNKTEPKPWDAATPDSMQVIKAGVLASTKYWSNRVGKVGSVSALLTLVAGSISTFVDKIGDTVAVALIGGAALIAAATAIAVAVFVGTDQLARGTATAARHRGRADVIAAYFGALRETATVVVSKEEKDVEAARYAEYRFLLAYSTHPTSTSVTRKSNGVTDKVVNLRMINDQFEIYADNDWFETDDIKSFTTESPPATGAKPTI